MFHFYTPWKRHEIKDFPTFSGGIEMEYRREMGSRFHDLDFKNDDAGQKDLLITLMSETTFGNWKFGTKN